MRAVVDADELAGWVRARAAGRPRYLLGLAGPPGSGKSTLAERLARSLGAPVAPMDGFHRSNAELDRLGLRDVKGAPATFDAGGFVDAARTMRAGLDVSLPTFDRDLDEPRAGGVHVAGSAPIVVVEGNYLLLAEPPWAALADLLDDVAFLDVDPGVRVERLVARHVAHGRGEDEARAFVLRSDEANAALVDATRHRATLLVAGR